MKSGSINIRQCVAEVNESFCLEENPVGDSRHKSGLQTVPLIMQAGHGGPSTTSCDSGEYDISGVSRFECLRQQTTGVGESLSQLMHLFTHSMVLSLLRAR